MAESKAQGVVYVKRATETPATLPAHRNPTKRRRVGENPSVAWYNMEKSKPVKPRCTEFDIYTRKSNPFQGFSPLEQLKHKRKITAIRNDMEFEKTEWEKEICSSEPSSSTSTEHASSSSSTDSEDAESNEPSQLSDVVLEKKFEQPLFLPCRNTEKGKHGMMNSQIDFNADPEDNILELDTETAFEVMETNSYMDSAYNFPNKTALIDVNITVNASYQAEKVPLVCLTSRVNGKAILGHPIEIEELTDSYKILLPGKENVAHGDERRAKKLVWRTSRRTPVCYVTNPVSSSVFKKAKGKTVSENVGNLFLKNSSELKRGRTAASRTCVPVGHIFGKLLAEVAQLHA